MQLRTVQYDLLLLLTALIWGFAFVAQRAGMAYVGPFTYSAVRFALGCGSLLPLLLFTLKREDRAAAASLKTVFCCGGLTGLVLFIAVSLQQIGMVYTTAGKAGFITGLYVVLVPILGIFSKQRTAFGTWLGAIIAVVGLYLLSITENFTIAFGDLLELIGAFFWAGHVHVISRFSGKIHPIKLAFAQFLVCSILSLLTALFFETITLTSLLQAGIPILYGGVCSVGIAYTLQVVAQQHTPAAHAAILLSLEAVFAVFGGVIILNEILTLRGLLGCAFMFAGMLVSQFLSQPEKR